MLTFAVAFFLAIMSPGPGVLSTAGVGSAFGFNAGFRYVTGLFIGTNLVGLGVVTGLAAALFAIPGMRVVLLSLSTAYLLYMAARIALAGSRISFVEAHRKPGIVDGVLLQLVNPKAYIVNTFFITGFPFLPEALVTEIILKFIIMNALWIPIHLLWLWGGAEIKRLNLPHHIQRAINLTMAFAMLVVIVLAIMTSL